MAQELLGIMDTDEAKNGLLWIWPVEVMFEDSRCCFSLERDSFGSEVFRFHLLDNTLRNVGLNEVCACLLR